MEPDPLAYSLYIELICFVVALAACALFSFLETSVTALRLFKLKELSTTTKRYRYLLESLEKNPHQVLISVIIASSLAEVTASALITIIMECIFAKLNLASGLGFSLGIGIATCAILLFGEVIPKGIAKSHGDKLFRSTLWIINITYYILAPFSRLLITFSNRVIEYTGATTHTSETLTSEREIRFLIDYINQQGLMEKEKTEMLQSIFNLGLKPVREIMIPDIDIAMINVQATIQDALELYTKYQFSRLPVYEENQDNIIGMVHQKDVFMLISGKQTKSIREILRPILFVPESMKINQLLREFRHQQMHIAMVINEYGTVTGLVTLEDVLEEIVGDIRDEFEEVTQKVIQLEQGGWLVDATIDLESLTSLLHITFEVESAVTLAGFLTEQLQHLPKKGERILYKKFYFQVHKASHKRVFQVLIFNQEDHQLENLTITDKSHHNS